MLRYAKHLLVAAKLRVRNLLMGRLLLVGVAGLSVLSASTAQADSLPNTFVGSWCLDITDNEAKVLVYNRRTLRDKCEDGLNIAANSYTTNEFLCIIKKAKRIKQNTYLIDTHCGESPEVEWDTEGDVIQILDGQLLLADKPYTEKALQALRRSGRH